MIVCHCRAVNDRVVRKSIKRGAGSIREIAQRCGAGSRCGGCWPALQQLLAEQGRAEPGVVAAPAGQPLPVSAPVGVRRSA